MNHWLRRIRGALGMGITWAVSWAVAGIGIGVLSTVTPFLPWDIFFDAFDAPLPAMAVPGFFYGALFSVVLGIAGRNRRFADLSMPRFIAWGALSGVLLPVVLIGTGLESPTGGQSLDWARIGFMAATLCLFSAGSAAATLAIARRAERGDARDAGGDSAALNSGDREVEQTTRERVDDRRE